MATINAVRLVNINIDGGDKLIPHNTFSFRGLQSLFLLENGGGKTTFIHLLLQVILPNTPSGKRSLCETLQEGKNGFIIVEWKLDSEGKKRLLTGFSFENRKEAGSGKNSLRYYMYTIEYLRGEFSIDDLPVYSIENNKKYVTSYEVFRQKLKQITKVPVIVRNSKERDKYQSELRSHGIIPEEWEDIKKINVSEGAADKFFEQADTVTKLLERLFIPSLETALFMHDKEGNTLADAFYKFQENLLKIPDIKKNIEDFTVVEDNVESVIKSVENYELKKEEMNKKKDYVFRLAETYDNKSNTLAVQLFEKRDYLKRSENDKKELEWKINSYKFYQKQNELLEMRNQLNEAKKKLEEHELLIENANRKTRELKAIRAYNEFSNQDTKLKGLREQIDNIEKEDEELKQILDQKCLEASYSWLIEQNKIKKELDQIKSAMALMSEEQEGLKIRNKALQNEAVDLAGKKGKLVTWFEKVDAIKEILRQWFEEWELLNPVECLEKAMVELEMIKQEKSDISQMVDKAYTRVDEENNQKIELVKQNAKIDAAINNITHQLEQYISKSEQVSSMLSAFGMLIPKTQNNLNEVLISLENELSEKESEVEKYKIVERDITANLERLKKTQYFVPNDELENLKGYLEKRNIFVVLGSEWLSGQELNENTKREILDRVPLLPYAILVEKSQLKEIPRELNKVKWDNSSPIIFLEKEALLTVEKREEDTIGAKLVTSHDNTWVFQNIDVELFVNRNKIKSLIVQYEEDLEATKGILSEGNAKVSEYKRAIRELKEFHASYSFEYEDRAKEDRESLKNEHEKNEKDIQTLESSVDESKGNIESWKLEIVGIEKQIKGAEEKERVAKDFAECSSEEQKKSRELKEINARISEIDKELSGMDNRSQEISAALSSHHGEEREKAISLETHNKEKTNYNWMPATIYGPPLDYQLAKTLYESTNEILTRKHSGLLNLQESAKQCEENIEREKEIIAENEIEFSWLQSNKRVVSPSEITAAKREEKELIKTLKPVKEEEAQKGRQYNETKGEFNQIVEGIKDTYDKEPYTYENALEHQKFEHELILLVETQKSRREEIGSLEEESSAFDKSYEILKSALPEFVQGVVTPIEGFECEIGKLVRKTNDEIGQFKGFTSSVREAKSEVGDQFENFKRLLESTNNNKIKQLAKQFDVLLAEERLFDSNYVIDKFTRVLEASTIYKSQLLQSEIEVEKDRERLIEMAIRRTEAIYERIIEMPKSSRMKLYGKDIQAIKLRWAKLEEAEAKAQLSRHIESVVEDINKMVQDGSNEESIRRYIQAQLDTKVLMKCYAPFHQCRIEIFKPKKEEVLKDKNVEYFPWEIAVKWSGGEQYTVYMTMFMVYIMHIRQTTTGREKEPFTILVDNPFGKASNDHIVDPILETANKNNIQLICLTAHDTPRIISKFPVVYSNVYHYEPNAKVEILQTQFKETMETLKYINDSELVEQIELI